MTFSNILRSYIFQRKILENFRVSCSRIKSSCTLPNWHSIRRPLGSALWYRYHVMCFILGRKVDGEAFLLLTREDFGVIFPSNDKFLVASRLFRISQQIRMTQSSHSDTNNLLDELSDIEGENSSYLSLPSTSHSTLSVHSSKSPSSASKILRKRTKQSLSQSVAKKKCTSHEFQLPVFSPDLKQCIRKDAFYTSTQRNRLIKESCIAMRGHFWELGEDITNSDKKKLARMLYNLAPKSLGDTGMDSSPDVGACFVFFILYVM